MNRIYKVIYSKARQCYIVVSELAKSNHKSSQQGADHTNTPALARIIAVALAAGALTWGSVPGVSWAADTGQADTGQAYTGQNATTIQGGIHYFSVNPEDGNRNKNYENDGAVGVDSLAVGAGAYANGRLGATALGNDAVADGERALAVGNGSKATGLDTIAIGTGSQGEAAGTNAIAIGEQSHARGEYTTTVGSYSEATATGAVSLGQQAKSKGAYSTSIGMMANGMAKDYKGGTAADFSTAVGAYSESSGLASVALGGFSKATDKFASALGYGSKAGLRGTAVGAASQVSAEGGTAVGLLSKASAIGSVALGMSSVADREAGRQGYHPVSGQMVDTSPAWQSSWGAISVGAGASQDKNDTLIPQQTRQIINLAAGTEDTDAVNVAQLKASKTKYYSVNDSAPGAIFDNEEFEKNYTNKNNDGAKSYYAMAAGYGTYAAGEASTVIGSYSVIQNDKVKERDDESLSPQGATAVSVGSFNFNLNTPLQSANDFSKWYSGTANSIVGQGNLTKDSNGVLIYGAGNKITNSYRGDVPINMLVTSMNPDVYQNPESFMDKVGEAVLQSGGQVMAIGGGNVADKAYMTQLMGVGNKVQGADITFTPPELQNDEDDYERYITAFNSAFNTQATRLNYVDGFYNKLTNAKNDYVIGMANDISGDDVSSNKSNIVIGDFHQMRNGSNNVILGSQDGNLTQKRYNTDGTLVTEESVNRFTHQEKLEDAVMIGHNADVQKNGGVALGAGSVASREAGVAGYDPATKKASGDTSATWKATDAAVSVGKSDGTMTRQITGVAAGTKETDAVNVAQLQKALDGAKDGNDTLKSNTNALKLDGNTLSMSVKDTAGNEVSGSVDLSKFAKAVDTNTTYTLSGQANQDNTTTITLKDNNGKENSVTVATKDTRNTVKAGENVTLDTKDNSDGSHEYTVNVKADGKVEAGSTKIVSGGTVYNETRVKQDGKYVKVSNTAGENLSVLDNQVASNSSNITNLNGRVNNLDSKVNKVGAGAAALAALHPLDFDPEDKWDFAVGYGNYRDANSVAVGAFYRPDDDTMFSVGTNFGNGENMINAGVSFKFGPKGKSQVRPGSTQEITELRATIARQDDQLKKQDSEIKELKAMVQQLMAKQDKQAATK